MKEGAGGESTTVRLRKHKEVFRNFWKILKDPLFQNERGGRG